MGESVYPPLTMFFVAPKLLEVWRLWLSQLGFLKNRLGAKLHPSVAFVHVQMTYVKTLRLYKKIF